MCIRDRPWVRYSVKLRVRDGVGIRNKVREWLNKKQLNYSVTHWDIRISVVLVFLPVGMNDVQRKSSSDFVCNFLPQAGINGATSMMILHKITFSMIQNVVCNQFLSTLT